MKKINKILIVLSIVFFVGVFFSTGNAEASSIKIKKQTIYNNDGVKIQVMGLHEYKNGYEVKYALYNKSNHMVSADISAYAVNNMSAGNVGWDDTESADNVMKGNNALFKLKISKSYMKRNYIKTIKTINFVILLKCGEEDMAVIQKTIKTNKDNGEYDIVKSKKIYSDENMTVSYINKDRNNVYFLIKNNLDKYMDISFDACSVNGWSYDLYEYASDTLFDISMPKGTYYIAKFNVGKGFMKEYDVKKINKIQFIITAETDIINMVVPTSLKYAEIKTEDIKWTAK